MINQDRIRFGPSGNSDSFYEQGYKSTWQAPKWISEMGLSAFEYSFGHGTRMREETALEIRREAEKYGIALSVHLPYYINLTSPEQLEKNKKYFLDSVRIGTWMGAVRGVFHPGYAGGERLAALSAAATALRDILAYLDENGYSGFTLCPETMGKVNQLGDLDEMLALCALDERLMPCVDFGHLHARGQGALKSREDFAAVLDAVENGAGAERARRMHIHFSRIEFTAAGEKMHRTFADIEFGPEFPPLAELLWRRRYTPVIIAESRGTMAEDALAMQKMYEAAAQTEI